MDRANITDYSTRSGMKVSAAFLKLHRDILAGSTDEAISTAYDLYRTSAVMLEELWKQLELEAVYTIGLAEQGALAYIYNLRCICYHTEPYMPDAGGMQALSFIQAIRYLCGCEKEQSLEQEIRKVQDCYDAGVYPVIPAFARDHHNHAGRELGHTPLDFLYPDGGSKVVPEAEGAEPYKKRLIELLTPIYGGENGKAFRSDAYNHFYEMESPHGLNLELLQSAFQKSIRRALEPEVLMLTYEAFLSGGEMEAYLWERIVIMSVEDIGMGDVECTRIMYAYSRVKDQFADRDEVRLGFLMQAVRILCRSPKERGTELIKGILVQECRNGDRK